MNYPFAAIVGQHKLTQALMLCAVNPAIGGVLIRGEKGTAKSTAARGLAEIMPPISIEVNESQFLSSSETVEICGECLVDFKEIPVPFVNLPLGATEDRVLGSIDLEGILNEKKKRLQPGLLAMAHLGILYIDEVNLLPDHLVDVLLDVAAMGVNTVQREGLSESHPARFTLIGTMNPEEGNLRPQFLDRFGLMVDVEAPKDVTERTEVVRRRITFEQDKEIFVNRWASAQKVLQEKIRMAQQLLPKVTMPDGLLTLISQLCTELNVTSLRADIVMYKTAVTLAALDKRAVVSAHDIRAAADLVLPHRKQKKNPARNPAPDNTLDNLMHDNDTKPPKIDQNKSGMEDENQSENSQPDAGNGELNKDGNQEQIFAPVALAEKPSLKIEERIPAKQELAGWRNNAVNAPRGRHVDSIRTSNVSNVSILPTIQQAVLRDPENFQVKREDLHQKIYSGKTGTLVLFVVDASGSMAAGKRMEAVKGSVLDLLTDAYQKRDMVGVISFRGVEAQLLLKPTKSIDQAEVAMQNLPTGGRTPLPHALAMALQITEKLDPITDPQPLLIILSDGKANVPLPGGGDAWQQTLELCGQLKDENVAALVLDTENQYIRFGKAKEMAEAIGAEYLSLNDLSSETITTTISAHRNQAKYVRN
jgi:magnesium chelatase subunit D